MSGHSKWSTIKRKKGAADAKRGALFTKLAREVIVAARSGSPDPGTNFRLRIAVQKARDNNMPVENIERAIRRGSGEAADGASFSEVTYEGYGPGGAAVLVQAMTDNRNRTISEVRRIFSQNSGNLGDPGCVAWIFETKGVIAAQTNREAADDIALAAIDAGADDVKVEGETLEVVTAPETLEGVRKSLEADGATLELSELQMVPTTTAALDATTAERALRLLDQLEELDDVQKVYSNADFPDEVLAQAAG